MDKVKEIEKQYDRIYRYCYFKLRQREAAEDITQETFLRFLESETYQNEGKALQYFYTVARNLCIDEYRKAGRKIEEPGEKALKNRSDERGLEDQLVCSIALKEMRFPFPFCAACIRCRVLPFTEG